MESRQIIPRGDDVISEGDQLYVIGKSDATGEILRLAGHEDRKLERVMIAGGTEIGELLAGRLEKQGVVPVIFEADKKRCAELAEKLASTLVLNGDATDLDLLAAEGVDGVGGFVAITPDDENNIISCLVAKNMGALKTIAQIKRLEYLDLASRVRRGCRGQPTPFHRERNSGKYYPWWASVSGNAARTYCPDHGSVHPARPFFYR